jgi:flagella basal body P-ring formation protein FlgA
MIARAAALLLFALATAATAEPAPSTDIAVVDHAVDVAVLDHAIDKGTLIAATDFTVAQLPPAQVRGALRARDAAGMEAARALAPGAIVRASDIIRPQLVRRGAAVTIELRDTNLLISTSGRALANGALGDSVRVVTDATNHTLTGVVARDGVVRIAAQ